MTFKEQLQADLDSVFFNENEFAEEHDFNGDIVPVIMDNDELLKLELRKEVDTDGIFSGKIMFFVQDKLLSFEPFTEQYVTFDGKPYTVTDVKHDNGVYTVVIEANRS